MTVTAAPCLFQAGCRAYCGLRIYRYVCVGEKRMKHINKTLRDYWDADKRWDDDKSAAMKRQPTLHCNCRALTGLARPGKTARNGDRRGEDRK